MIAQVDFDQDVDGQTLAWFLDHGNLQLADNLAPCTITSDEILRADEVLGLSQLISHTTQDPPVLFLLEVNDTRLEPHIPPLGGRSLHDDRLEDRLRQINVMARRSTFILALPLRIISPRIDPRVLLARHVMAPARVHHTISLDGLIQTCLLEVDISQAFECSGIGDVGSGCLRRR